MVHWPFNGMICFSCLEGKSKKWFDFLFEKDKAVVFFQPTQLLFIAIYLSHKLVVEHHCFDDTFHVVG